MKNKYKSIENAPLKMNNKMKIIKNKKNEKILN